MIEHQAWEPLSFVDFVLLGMVATFQVAALLVCAHLVRWRKWPPYLTKNVDVVVSGNRQVPFFLASSFLKK